MDRVAVHAGMKTPHWIFTFKKPCRIRLSKYGKIKTEGQVLTGSRIRVAIGDAVFVHRRHPLGGWPWIQYFRIRLARSRPAVHFGKKHGDQWHWLHTQGEALGFSRRN